METSDDRPAILLVHGSATDRATWTIQKASLSREFSLHAPDRPGADGLVSSVEEQAARLIREHQDVGPLIAVGSSFGAIVCLEMARQRAPFVRGLVLIEPPLASSDYVPSVPIGFGCQFDAIVAAQGGEAAAEMFLRLVLGDETFERIPAAFRDRSVRTWRHIRADSLALSRYQPRYDELRKLDVPVLLLGGQRSAPMYGETLDALEAVLPQAERVTIKRAGHMLHAEAPRQFAKALRDFTRMAMAPVVAS